jgi:serine/threonine protein kinase
MIGKTLSHFRIIEKLGAGGRGEVFLAEDVSLHRKVAVKFLPQHMLGDPVARERFLREASRPLLSIILTFASSTRPMRSRACPSSSWSTSKGKA